MKDCGAKFGKNASKKLKRATKSFNGTQNFQIRAQKAKYELRGATKSSNGALKLQIGTQKSYKVIQRSSKASNGNSKASESLFEVQIGQTLPCHPKLYFPTNNNKLFPH